MLLVKSKTHVTCLSLVLNIHVVEGHIITCPQSKKVLYVSLVRSKLLYCSPIWHPRFLKDIKSFESVQRRATKFIPNDYRSDYKSRLPRLNLLPLMMHFKVNDVLFFIKKLKVPSPSFNVTDYIHFCSASTRSSSFLKLKLPRSKLNTVKHFYFNRLPRLWNSLPVIDLDESLYIIKFWFRICGATFFIISIQKIPAHFTMYVLVFTAHLFL